MTGIEERRWETKQNDEKKKKAMKMRENIWQMRNERKWWEIKEERTQADERRRDRVKCNLNGWERSGIYGEEGNVD